MANGLFLLFSYVLQAYEPTKPKPNKLNEPINETTRIIVVYPEIVIKPKILQKKTKKLKISYPLLLYQVS